MDFCSLQIAVCCRAANSKPMQSVKMLSLYLAILLVEPVIGRVWIVNLSVKCRVNTAFRKANSSQYPVITQKQKLYMILLTKQIFNISSRSRVCIFSGWYGIQAKPWEEKSTEKQTNVTSTF